MMAENKVVIDTEDEEEYYEEYKRKIQKPVAKALSELGRVAQDVPGDGYCIFHAIARQSKKAKNYKALLRLTSDQAIKFAKYYSVFFPDGKKTFLTTLEDLKAGEGHHHPSSIEIDGGLTIIQQALDERIVLIGNSGLKSYPATKEPITADTIVIIDDSGHFLATQYVGVP